MVNLQKIDDSSVKFVFTDSDHYLVGNGEIVVPINSLSLVIDESEMVTFKKASTGDPFISFRADNSNLGTKEAIEQFYKENMVGAGGISEEEVQDIVDAATSGMATDTQVQTLEANKFDGATYDSANHLIKFTANGVQKATIDASAFIKDGMVSTVAIEGDYLVITFNTDAGKDPIRIPLSSIFDPSVLDDYYTKTQIDGFLNNATTMLTTISGEVQTNSANIQDIYDTIDEKEEVIASALTEVRQDINKKASVYYVDFWGMFNDSYEMDDAKWNEMVEAYNNNAIFYATPNGDYTNTATPLTVEYIGDNQLWFNIPWGNGYTSLVLNRIEGRDGYEYVVTDANEYNITVDDQLDSGSTNLVQNGVITQALNAKADLSALTSIESSITAVSNDLNTLSGAVIDNEYTVSQSLNDLNSRKLDISAYTPTDLSQYWTSAQTQSAIDDVKAYYISFATIATTGIRDEDWDGIVAAIDNHRPIYAGYPRNDGGILYYGVECMNKNSNNTQIVLTSSDDNSHYFYTFTKNGSNDYTFTSETRPYVTDAEKTAWNAKQNALSAGTGIEISGNVISAIGGGGATYSAGTNISIDTANTINCTLPITANTTTFIAGSPSKTVNSNILIGSTDLVMTAATNSVTIGFGAKGGYSTVAIGQGATAGTLSKANDIAIGNQAKAQGGNFIAIGTTANATGTTKMNLNNQIKVDTNNQVYIKDKDNVNEVCIQDAIAALGGLKLVKIYQADYDALATKDNDTLYLIPDGDSNNSDWEQ